MPDPKLPTAEDPESEQDEHGGALAKAFQQIEDELPSEKPSDETDGGESLEK